MFHVKQLVHYAFVGLQCAYRLENNFGYQTKLKQSNTSQQSQITKTIPDMHNEAQNQPNYLKISEKCIDWPKMGKNTSKQPAKRVKLQIYWPISMIFARKSRIFY